MLEDSFWYQVRSAEKQEWEAVIAFVWNAFLQSEGKQCTALGRDLFWQFITNSDLKDSFAKGEYPVLLALKDDRIIGAAAVRYHNHLSLLFVDEAYRYRGIGKELLHIVMQYVRDMGERYISLQAVSGAVPFYQRYGFRGIRPEEEFAGIRVTYMEKYF